MESRAAAPTVALLVIAFAMTGLDWNVAASVDYAQGQIPYMISGGLIGLGFVFFACGMVVSNAFNAYHQVTTSYNALGERTDYTYDATSRLPPRGIRGRSVWKSPTSPTTSSHG